MSTVITLSKWALSRVLIEAEVSSEAHYKAKLQYPIWPGKISGITIGLGYDLAHHTPEQVAKDLDGILEPADITRLQKYCGLMGTICKSKLPIPVKLTWSGALQLFYRSSLPKYVKEAADAYDELETLHPYEQTMFVDLVYNRGSLLKDAPGSTRRKEMRLLADAIKADDDKMMAALIRQMKRLWDEKNEGGLIKRRELEAQLVELPDDPIPEEDKLYITI